MSRYARPGVTAERQLGRAWMDRVPTLIRATLADKRMLLVAALILTHIWRFHDLTPQLAQLRLAAVVTVTSWVVLLLSPNWPALRAGISRPYAVAFLLWSLWIVVGTPAGLSPDNTWEFITVTHYKNILLYMFLVSSIWGLRRIKIGFLTNVAGALALTFFYVKGGMPGWGSPVPMYDVNDLALLLTMTLPLAVWAATSIGTKKWERIFLWTAPLSFVLAVTGTGSRGGFLALCVVLMIMMFRFKAVPRKAKMALLAGAGALLLAAPAAYWDRMATMLDLSQDYNTQSDVGRLEIWKRGLGYVQDRPLTGLGAQNFPIAEGTLRVEARAGQNVKWSAAHSSYMQALAETGYVGFALWLGIFVAALFSIRRMRARAKRLDHASRVTAVRLLDSLTAGLVAYGVGGLFLSQAYAPYVLVLLALLAGVERMVEQMSAAAGRNGRGRGRGRRPGPIDRVPQPHPRPTDRVLAPGYS